MAFKLLSYRTQTTSAPRAGLLINDAVFDCADGLAEIGLPGGAESVDPTSVLSLLGSWALVRPALDALARSDAAKRRSVPLKSVKLAAPILYPINIFCAAANYYDHIKEMSGREIDKSSIKPYFFNKVSRQTVIATGDAIRRPAFTEKLDWEAEIVAVIGKTARNVTADKALDYVMGYTIINDLSARNFLKREDWPRLSSDWLWQKSFDTSAPMGPWITLREEVDDPQNLRINTWVNDTLEQDTHSSRMIFSIAEQIEALSEHLTLLPGDVIATGTGSGVGVPRGKFLQPGDVCRIEIERLGTIKNTVVADKGGPIGG